MNHNHYPGLSVIAFSILALASCKTSTSPNADSGFTALPKAGSSFTSQHVTRDTMGMVMSTDTSVERVVQSNYSIGGKTDVDYVINTHADGTTDTSYLRYVSGGDVQMYTASSQGTSMFPPWVTLPFSSHATQHFVVDTIMDLGGGMMMRDTIDLTVKFERTENFVVKGTSVSCSVVSMTMLMRGSMVVAGVSQSFTGVVLTEMSLAPSIGWQVHSKDISNTFGGQRNSLNESTLINYTLVK